MNSANASVTPSEERIPWPTKIAFGLGNAVEAILTRSFELFVLFFYTQVMGLSGVMAGAAILVAMLADAITDPLVGAYSDSLKARWGRRHTLMFISAIPTAFFFVGLFFPPGGLGDFGLSAWLAFTAIGLRVSVTLFYIPWSTQTAELTDSTKERVTLAVIRNVVSAVAGFAVITVAFDVFFVASEQYPRGQENPDNYLPFALALAGTLIILILISAAGTYKRLREREDKLAPSPSFTFSALIPAWKDMVFRFKNFRSLLLSGLFILAAFSMYNAMALYLGSYFWQLESDQIKNWQLSVVIGLAVTLILGKLIIDRVPHKPLFCYSIGFSSAFFALPILARLLGFVEVGSDAAIPLLLASNAMAGLFLGVVVILTAVITAEIADEYQIRKKINATAMLFGFVFFVMKSASGFGKLVAGLIVDIVALPDAENAHRITQTQLDQLGWWAAATLVLLGALSVISFTGYQSRTPPD